MEVLAYLGFEGTSLSFEVFKSCYSLESCIDAVAINFILHSIAFNHNM